MASHYYAFVGPCSTGVRNPAEITVGTAPLGATAVIELNVTDGALTARQVYNALRYLADLFARRESGQVIVPGTLIG